jgi:hypothetical protein
VIASSGCGANERPVLLAVQRARSGHLEYVFRQTMVLGMRVSDEIDAPAAGWCSSTSTHATTVWRSWVSPACVGCQGAGCSAAEEWECESARLVWAVVDVVDGGGHVLFTFRGDHTPGVAVAVVAREVAAGDFQADPVPWQENVGRRGEVDGDLVDLPGVMNRAWARLSR